MKVKKGFTLIELLVVIAIIAMLLSILMPSLGMAKQIAQRVVCSTQLKNLGLGTIAYTGENDDELPFTLYMQRRYDNPNEVITTTPYNAFRVFQVNLSAAVGAEFPETLKSWTYKPGGHPILGQPCILGYGWLYYNDFIDTGKAFYCPSAKASTTNITYEQHNEVRSWPWVTEKYQANGSPTVLGGYYYMPQSKTRKVTVASNSALYTQSIEVPVAARKIDDLDTRSVLGVDQMRIGQLPHKSGGSNGVCALFADGHVDFNNNSEVFKHPLWNDVNDPHNAPAGLRAIIYGIEGKTQYMQYCTP